MDANMRMLVRELRAAGSQKAADFLIERYPAGSSGYGIAFLAIAHLSWKPNDQTRLAEHYLARIPFVDSRPYEAFAKVMSITKLVRIIENFIPESDGDRDLLKYYIGPVLSRRAKTDRDRSAIAHLMAKI